MPTEQQSPIAPRIGLFVGPVLGVAAFFLLPEETLNDDNVVVSGLSYEGRVTVGVTLLMAMWWLTEALPLAMTSLLPIVLLPTLGAMRVQDVTHPYGDRYVFLYLGGCILASAIERWNLHRRFALHTVRIVGTNPSSLVAGFMIAAALMSMWVSNTATTITMLPIGISVAALISERLKSQNMQKQATDFPTCLLLSIAYGASIGGVGSLIGTPTNAVLASFMEQNYDRSISIASWFLIGLPLVVVFLPITWFVMTRFTFPLHGLSVTGSRKLIDDEIKNLGRMSSAEKRVLIVFTTTAALWIMRSLIIPIAETVSQYGGESLASQSDSFLTWYRSVDINDSSIAVAAATLLFLIPSGRERTKLLDWTVANKIPWDVLLLFGGGLSIAGAIRHTGVADALGQQFAAFNGVPLFLVLFALAAAVIFMTEITSNVATTAALLPVLASVAVGMNLDPLLLLLPATLAASFAFMLPVATPPNALVFASGHIRIPQMARAGFSLNILGILVIPIWSYVVSLFVTKLM